MRLALSPLFARFLLAQIPRFAPGRKTAQARVAILSIAPAFALVLMTAWVIAESATPEITDTEYHARLKIIRATAAEHPDRPLGLVLGSSHTVWAFQPEQLPEPGVGEVCWVNAAHLGAGPTLNRVILHRLLRDGVRPRVVVMEVMPTFFTKESSRFISGYFATTDLSLVRRYSDKPFGFDYHFLRHRLTRAGDLARVSDPYAGRVPLLPRGGHPHMEVEITAEERQRRTAFANKNNGDYLRRMTVRPAADRVFRDTLRETAAHDIQVVLLRSPEGPVFRSWYDPEGLARFDQYISGVASEHGARILDARLWLDEEDFYDSHHVLKRGADKFTSRFARELPTVLAGR